MNDPAFRAKLFACIEDLKSRRAKLEDAINSCESLMWALWPDGGPMFSGTEIPALPPEGNSQPEKPPMPSGYQIFENPRKQRRLRGTGSITKKAHGRFWYIRYYDKTQKKYFELSTLTEDYAEAEKLLDSRLAAIKAESGPARKQVPFEERPKRNGGRPPMFQKGKATESKFSEPAPTAIDPKCRRCPALHTKSQHVGANGKCIACWCPGFVGLEEFANAR